MLDGRRLLTCVTATALLLPVLPLRADNQHWSDGPVPLPLGPSVLAHRFEAEPSTTRPSDLVRKSRAAAEAVSDRTDANPAELALLARPKPVFTERYRRNAKQRHVPDHCFQPSNLTPKETEALVRRIAREEGLDPNFAVAVARQESRLGRTRVSPVGAMGTMQLMPGTAEMLGVKDACSPPDNIRGGVRYLNRMLAEFGGHKMLAAAAYNAGPHRIHQYKGIPPFNETVNYVAKIMGDTEGIDVQFKNVGRPQRAKRVTARAAVKPTTKAKATTPARRKPATPRSNQKGTWTSGLVQHF